jgi:hypothetical protein
MELRTFEKSTLKVKIIETNFCLIEWLWRWSNLENITRNRLEKCHATLRKTSLSNVSFDDTVTSTHREVLSNLAAICHIWRHPFVMWRQRHSWICMEKDTIYLHILLIFD